MINITISIIIVLIPAVFVFRTGRFKLNFFISWGLILLFTLYTHGIAPGSFAMFVLGWLYPLIFCGIAYYTRAFIKKRAKNHHVEKSNENKA
jgi:FtsH-binding integral membrane protein